MKKLAIAIAAIALIGTPAFAADLNKPVYKKAPPPPPAPVYSWTGWYVGGNVGYSWGDASTDLAGNGSGASCIFAACVAGGGILPGGFRDLLALLLLIQIRPTQTV